MMKLIKSVGQSLQLCMKWRKSVRLVKLLYLHPPLSNDKFCQFHEEITAVTFAFNGMMQFMKSKTRVTIPQVRIKKNMILMNLLSIHTLSQPLTK